MKRYIHALLLAGFSLPAVGHWGFVGNPDLPYPPGCAGDPSRTLVPFLSGASIELRNRLKGGTLPVQLSAYRASCSETNRSVIWLRFSAQAHIDEDFVLELPVIRALLPSGRTPLLALVSTPNGWGEGRDPHLNRRLLVHSTHEGYGQLNSYLEWTFMLDNNAGLSTYPEGVLSAETYNDAFSLHLFIPPDWPDGIAYSPDNDGWKFPVPATRDLLEPEPGLPLSGRLSGLWVVEGAPGQGFAMSISNRVAPAGSEDPPRELLPLVVFLSHYTYGPQGELLWLTGSADFTQGSREVTMQIVRVDGGSFMGDKPANREIIGSVRLEAFSCNDLVYEFDYSAIGLGTGTHHLKRLYSLETAGHECRDYPARVDALIADPGDDRQQP